MLTLSCAPSGAGSVSTGAAPAAASSSVEHGGRAARTGPSRPRAARCRPCRLRTPGDLAAGVDRDDLGAGHQLGAGGDRRRGQPVGDRAHAADRHVPVAGAAADEVVEEADVLGQGRPVEVGEGADEGVGGHDAAHRVVGERRPQRLPQRPLDQRVATARRRRPARAPRRRTAAAPGRSGRPAGPAPPSARRSRSRPRARRRSRSAPRRRPRSPPRPRCRPAARSPGRPAAGCRRSSAGAPAARRGRGRRSPAAAAATRGSCSATGARRPRRTPAPRPRPRRRGRPAPGRGPGGRPGRGRRRRSARCGRHPR